MSTLVSILMPTRNDIAGLRRALGSIKSTASNFSDIEILLRIDDDHSDRIADIPSLEQEFGVKAIVGSRGVGYINMGQFVDEMAAAATGKWAWLFDDDAWLIGDSWQPQLEKIEPTENGPVCAAEWYTLGGSQYHYKTSFSPPGLIVPMSLPKSLKHANPVDEQWLSEARKRKWKQVPLNRVEYCHCGRSR